MSLRLPSGLGRIGPLSWMTGTVYPPRSFAAFEDFAVGNGDLFGLYWPIGLEDREPLVCEIFHDSWSIVPAFSYLDAFLKQTGGLDEDGFPDAPSLEDDPHSPHACLTASREAAAQGKVEEACALAKRAIEYFPEHTAALAVLSAQCLRLGQHDEACRYAVRAVRSPPCFGDRTGLDRTWRWLSRQAQGPDDLAGDPIWLGRAALTAPPCGGTKQNDVYLALAGAAEGYTARGEVEAALSLWQAYAEFMSGETVSFRERYGITPEQHQQRQRTLEARLPAGLREPDSQ